MSQHIPVPPELEHLIEKREAETDRRGGERRKGEQRQEDLGPLGAIESAADVEDVPTTDRRTGKDRRRSDRRKKKRRKGST